MVFRESRSASEQAGELGAHQRYIPGVHRNLGTGCHRDAYIGLRKNRRIVYSIANHRDNVSFAL